MNEAPRRPTVGVLLSRPAHFMALGAGSGLSPVAPGTVGTLWAWLSFVALQTGLSAGPHGDLIWAGICWWAGRWAAGLAPALRSICASVIRAPSCGMKSGPFG